MSFFQFAECNQDENQKVIMGKDDNKMATGVRETKRSLESVT